jgi:hypothetical protein
VFPGFSLGIPTKEDAALDFKSVLSFRFRRTRSDEGGRSGDEMEEEKFRSVFERVVVFVRSFVRSPLERNRARDAKIMREKKFKIVLGGGKEEKEKKMNRGEDV